jgi:hypothetical protein
MVVFVAKEPINYNLRKDGVDFALYIEYMDEVVMANPVAKCILERGRLGKETQEETNGFFTRSEEKWPDFRPHATPMEQGDAQIAVPAGASACDWW